MGTRLASVHSVHIYENDDLLITRLCSIVATSLRLGDSTLIVATPEHRQQLVNALEQVGIDAKACATDGRYTTLDAQELLSMFMREGMPEPGLFRQTIGAVLLDARRRAQGRNQGLIVFGEMVALLWLDGSKEAALKLEELWNAAMLDVSFHLHCAYPLEGFGAANDIASVHGLHTHVLQ